MTTGPDDVNATTRNEGEAPIQGTMLGRLLGGSAVSLLGFMVTVLQALLLVPLLLSVWTAETFAVWVTALGIHAFLISCDVGFHAFLGVEIILKGLGQRAEVRKLFSVALRAWVVLSAGQLLVVGLMRYAGEYIPGVKADTVQLLKDTSGPLAVLVCQWILVGSLLSLVCRVLLAGGQTVLFQWFGMLHRTLLFLATIIPAWAGLGAFGVAVAYAGIASVSGLLTIVYVFRRYPGLVPWWADGTWHEAWSLFRRSTGLTLSNVLEQSTVGGLTAFVAGAFHELQVASFSTLRSLANFITQASGVVLNPAVPELGRSAAPPTIHKAVLIIESAFVIATAPLAMGLSFISPWVAPLYSAWTRHELPFDARLFIGLAAAVLARQVGTPLQYFLLATNRVQPQLMASAIRVGVLFGLLPVAIKGFGFPGVGAAIAAAEVSGLVYLASVTVRLFPEYGGQLPLRGVWLASGHVAVTVATLTAVLGLGAPRWPCLVGAAMAHGALLIAQVRSLPPELIARAARMAGLGVWPSWPGIRRA
jgi:hypothetical protein